jgi:hypothetical protein
VADPTLAPEILRALVRSVGFELRPVVLRGRELAEAFVAALRAAGHPAELVTPSGEAWHPLVDRLRRGGDGPIVVYGEAPIAGPVADALAVLNRQRDVVTAALPHVLWWCGSDAFLVGSAAAMPDFWSIRAPTIVFGEGDAREVEPPALAPLMPQTEADIRAFAEWLVREYAEDIDVDWIKAADGKIRHVRRPRFGDVESVKNMLRALVPKPAALLNFGEALWKRPLPRSASAALVDHLGHLGAFRAPPTDARMHPTRRAVLVPENVHAPSLRFRTESGATVIHTSLVPSPAHPTLLFLVPNVAAAEALLTSLALDFRSSGGHVVERYGEGFARGPSLRDTWHARQGTAAAFLERPEPVYQPVTGTIALTGIPTTVVLPANLDPGPREGWERLWLLPLNDAEAAALINAWLPDPRERDALLTLLAALPHGADILHDLGRLLPLLHSLTALPTHVE